MGLTQKQEGVSPTGDAFGDMPPGVLAIVGLHESVLPEIPREVNKMWSLTTHSQLHSKNAASHKPKDTLPTMLTVTLTVYNSDS